MFLRGRWLAILALIGSMAFANETEIQLQQLTERLSTGDAISGFEHPIQARSMVADFYRLRSYKAAWTDKGLTEGLLKTLKESVNEGLLPDDYHYSELMQIYNSDEVKQPGYSQAQFELLLTDGVLTYAYHLIRGKIDPANMEKSWNYIRSNPLPADVLASLEKHVHEKTLVAKLNELKPDVSLYKKMRDGLAFYRELEKNVPFVVIAENPLLKPGAQSPVIPELRKRLMDMQIIDAGDAASELYDEKLVDAVKLFQQLHAMDDDGVIGKQTWGAINMSWNERINKLRVNLERTRWVYENAGDKVVLVNIAGFMLYLIEDSKLVWKTPVMTGTVKNETPLFTSRFSYMEINPTWTVPRSILRKSLINKFKANPQYIADKDYVLLDRAGKNVDVSSLDWSTLSKNNFPYTVVQQPGDKNALGQVKFIFPNSHSIYLHDTPARSLFSRSARAFSHGCVRVKDPFEFARLLMNDPEKWPAEKFQEILDTKKRTRVTIDRPIDVMLMYWTTEPFNGGVKIKFNPDIYNRDADVLAALDKPL